jgi:broad specificity phosphatase PhoE
MKNKYVFLRHAETIKDPDTHPKEWLLTPDALQLVNKYTEEGKFNGITKIYSSTEPKAVATGRPISTQLGLEINEMENFVEVKREKKFLTDEEFLAQKKKEVENLETVENGVESGGDALKRFEEGINKLESEYNGETILIISHGTVMSIYFAKLLNQLDNAFERWQKLKFCALGSVVNNQVVEDIV